MPDLEPLSPGEELRGDRAQLIGLRLRVVGAGEPDPDQPAGLLQLDGHVWVFQVGQLVDDSQHGATPTHTRSTKLAGYARLLQAKPLRTSRQHQETCSRNGYI